MKMIRIFASLPLFFLALSGGFVHAADKAPNLKIVKAVNPDNPRESYLIIESSDPKLKAELSEVLEGFPTLIKFEEPDENSALRSLLVVARKNEFIQKRHATRDCLIGVGACVLGIGIVQGGDDYDENNPPSGFHAFVGDKVVTGGTACLVGALWVTGIVFGIKGIIEIFSKDDTLGMLNDEWDADDIIKQTSLKKKSEKEFTIDRSVLIQKKVLPYILVNTWT